MSIKQMCINNVVAISEKTSIQEAAKMMAEKHVGCLLVFKENDESHKPIGIITDRDIVKRVVAKKTDLSRFVVSEVMSKDLLMLSSDHGIKQSIEAMCSKGVRRAPVMEKDKLCGIVAVDDLIQMIASELSDLAELVEHQMSAHE